MWTRTISISLWPKALRLQAKPLNVGSKSFPLGTKPCIGLWSKPAFPVGEEPLFSMGPKSSFCMWPIPIIRTHHALPIWSISPICMHGEPSIPMRPDHATFKMRAKLSMRSKPNIRWRESFSMISKPSLRVWSMPGIRIHPRSMLPIGHGSPIRVMPHSIFWEEMPIFPIPRSHAWPHTRIRSKAPFMWAIPWVCGCYWP